MVENIEKISESVADMAENGVPISVGFQVSSIVLLGVVLLVAFCVPVLLWRWAKNN